MLDFLKPVSIEQILEDNGAIITDSHLVLSSKKHSDAYVDMRVLAGNTNALLDIAEMISQAISERHETSENYLEDLRIVIVGPETLGRTFAEFTAMDIATNYCIYDDVICFAWCEMKKDGDKEWAEWNPKLNFAELVKGACCYIVDDLLTTAKSVKLVKQLIEESGGAVAGVVVAVRRDPAITAEVIGVPWLECLHEVNLQTYEADTCPLCEAEVPMLLRPGHGHEWIKDHPDYPTKDQQ